MLQNHVNFQRGDWTGVKWSSQSRKTNFLTLPDLAFGFVHKRFGTRLVLGYKKKKNKPWFSQEAWTLVDQRKAIKQKLIGARSERLKQRWQDEYRQKDREVKRQVRVDKRRRTEEIAKEAENTANQQHMKTLHTLTKVLSNERPRQSAAVMDKTGKILSDKESKIR